MEWSVIFTSVAVAAIVSAASNIIIARMKNHDERTNIRYEKLYAFYTELKALPTPPPALDGLTQEQVRLEVDYFNAIRKKYELAKPLLAVKFQKEIDSANEVIMHLTTKIMDDYYVAKNNGLTIMDGADSFKVSKLRIEFESKVENAIREQLSELN